MNNLVIILYILAFAMLVYGLTGLTGPKTAVRGNYIAAVGMGIAVVATLIKIRDTENWALIIGGLVLGMLLGVPPALRTKMTAMPQLVAMFNGVGGGTVALIAWAEFINSSGFSNLGENPTVHIIIGTLFAAIIGSISFWGSLIAFLKLQETLPGRPIGIGRLQQPVNLLLLVAAIGCAVVVGVGAGNGGVSQWWIVGVLGFAAVLGLTAVLPIGGADMPVVISLLNALTGLSAAAAGLALNNTAMIVAGMIVGASGTILTNLMAKAMNRSIISVVAGGFRVGGHRQVHERRGRRDPDGVCQPGDRGAWLRDGRRPGSARRQRDGVVAGGQGRGGQVCDPPGRRPHARTHERAPR